jgi:hypothetical protein
MWANEQEAAILSGVSIDRFRRNVRAWEGCGFPHVNSGNGKRCIPAILAFWGIPQNSFDASAIIASPKDDEDGKEDWGAAGKGQRWAS